MEEMESFQTDRSIEVFKGSLNPIFSREVISRFKRMSRVETNPHSFTVLNSFDDSLDLIKGIADLRPLPCGVLQKEKNRILYFLKGLINPLRNSFNGLIFGGFHSMTDMDDQIIGSQILRPLKIRSDGADGSLIKF